MPSLVFGTIITNSIIFVLTDFEMFSEKIGNAIIYGVSCITIVLVVCILCWGFTYHFKRVSNEFLQMYLVQLRNVRNSGVNDSADLVESGNSGNGSHILNSTDANSGDGEGGLGTSSTFPVSDSGWRWWRGIYSGSPSVTWSANPIYGASGLEDESTSQDSGISCPNSINGRTDLISSVEFIPCPSFSPPPVPDIVPNSTEIVSPYAVTALCAISTVKSHGADRYDNPSNYVSHC